MTAPADATLQDMHRRGAALRIPLSLIGGNAQAFADQLEAHRAALASHRQGEPDQPAPVAHELLERLILRVPESGPVESRGPDRFEIAPYEIVDDSPPAPAPPTLAQRKQELLIEMHKAAQAALDKIISPARAQLLGMESGEAAAKPVAKRSAAEKAKIKKFATYSESAVKISRAVAHAAVAIEELTDDTIHGWTPPKFD